MLCLGWQPEICGISHRSSVNDSPVYYLKVPAARSEKVRQSVAWHPCCSYLFLFFFLLQGLQPRSKISPDTSWTARRRQTLIRDHCHLLDIDSVCVPCVITSVNLCGLHHELIMLLECWKKRVAITLPHVTVILNSMALSYLPICYHLLWWLNYSGSIPSTISPAFVLFLNITHDGKSKKHPAQFFCRATGLLVFVFLFFVCFFLVSFDWSLFPLGINFSTSVVGVTTGDSTGAQAHELS